MGAYAEFKCMAASWTMAVMPDKLAFEEAAGAPNGALTAYHFLNVMGDIKKEEKVLVIGASGSVGAVGVQLAKVFEANVTGVCSTANIEFQNFKKH